MQSNQLDFIDLGNYIKDVFLNKERYQVNKNVPTFYKEGKYVGDFFNFTMLELAGNGKPPIFYHNYSPYDVISSKTTDYAAIFQNGERLADFKFDPYLVQRTAVMTSLIVKSLNLDISDKKILFIGTGRIAQKDLESLKVYFPKLKQVYFLNNSGRSSEAFTSLAGSMNIKALSAKLKDISEFDLIICHTNSKTPVITDDLISSIKRGALITSFSSEDFTELSSGVFDGTKADIIVDWSQTIDEVPELKEAIQIGICQKDDIIYLKDLFLDKKHPRKDKQYSVYRSHGTPMQNLAAMKLAVESGVI